MPGKRLQVEGPDDGSRALPSVPAPIQGTGRAHSLAQALEIALARAGVGVTYDDLMGLSGLAFRMPPWPEAVGLSMAETAATLDRLNQAFQPPLSVHGPHPPVAPADALDLVAEEIDAGCPCLALGWGSAKESWSIIAGHDRARQRLLGHCVLEQPREAYESWPPDLSLLVTIPRKASPPGRTAFLAAVERVHAVWAAESRGRHARWVAALSEPNCQPDLTHESAVELLADSRGAAVGFLSRLADAEEGNRGAWLARAAETYAGLLEVLEARGAAPLSQAALEGLRDPEWRAAWAERLEQMAALEEEAATALRLSSSAEFSPEESLQP